MSENKWVVLKQENCLYCKKALDLLQERGLEPEVIDLTTAPQIKDFIKACGLTTVPQVYLEGDRIGGFDDLEEHFAYQDFVEGMKRESAVWLASDDARGFRVV